MLSPFKCVTVSKYIIDPKKIIFQINAENFIEKSAVVFKMTIYNFTELHRIKMYRELFYPLRKTSG